MTTEFITVITTTDTLELAERISKALVERRLAACVQLFPITSVYQWKGNIEQASEISCFVKTRASLYESVEECIRSLHTYEVPEIVALPIVGASKSYLDWLRNETGTGAGT